MNKILTQLPSSILALGKGKYRIQSEAKVSGRNTKDGAALKMNQALTRLPSSFLALGKGIY
jgi:hypothetical protein